MSVPANPIPSLARAFEPERRFLLDNLSDTDLSAAQIVSEARRALDRTGARFSEQTSDPSLQKIGLWLLETVKAGADILDSGTAGDIVWHEVPAPAPKKPWGNAIFMTAAAMLLLLSLMQESRVGLITVGVLTGLHVATGLAFQTLLERLPFLRKPTAIEDNSGRRHKAELRITANTTGFVDALANSLRTADHILMRVGEPAPETRWTDNPRLMTVMQSLLEAAVANDGAFALKLINQEMDSFLAAEGIERLCYSKETSEFFDVLPGLDDSGKPTTAAPALKSGTRILRRGTVWKG